MLTCSSKMTVLQRADSVRPKLVVSENGGHHEACPAQPPQNAGPKDINELYENVLRSMVNTRLNELEDLSTDNDELL